MWNLWYLFPWCNNYIYILDLHNFITSWSFVIFSVYFHVSIHMSECVCMFWGVCEVYAQVCMQVYIHRCKRGILGILSPFLPPSLFFSAFTLNFLAMQVHRKFQEHFYMAMGVYLCYSCLCSTWSKPLSHFFSSTLSFNKSCQEASSTFHLIFFSNMSCC